ncbi:hypothetical protein C0Q70_16102 [Pomacea canaliculata]|uniref:Uncharacterized protein n=1 Tax=Pomacea canaliculata TaxID=400727 RepID=A0A2T7NNV0_POMCA|nr:hypothetical protein C0Q70_16102 [Pomacea canaliculata]
MVVPLPGSQAAGPVSQMAQTFHQRMTTSVGASSEARMQQVGATWLQAVPSRPRAMEEQIAELNRQHTEAQQRLQSLLDQQKRQHEQLHIFSTEDVVSGQNIQETTKSAVSSAVSPPISPISQKSELFTSLKPLHHFASMSREIKVALPMVDLNVSDGSVNSP